MILFLESGEQIRGDLIASAQLRNDASPIPVSLELDVRAGDGSMEAELAEGKLIRLGNGDKLRIVKAARTQSTDVQGDALMTILRVTALLDACHAVAFVRRTAILKEAATLSAIYKAAGATIPGVKADFTIDRFSCLVGDAPSFHIARALQEEGGIVRWKDSRLEFVRLRDLPSKEPVAKIPHNAADDVESGFLERHEVPWFFSTDKTGAPVFGNRDKPRSAMFVPFKNELRLRNMTRCLVRRKVLKLPLDMVICAGDLIEFADGVKLSVMTAAHVWESAGFDGGPGANYTRLWLGSVEE